MAEQQNEERLLFAITDGPDRYAFLQTLAASENSFARRVGFNVTFKIYDRKEVSYILVWITGISRADTPDSDETKNFNFLGTWSKPEQVGGPYADQPVRGFYDTERRQGWMEEISKDKDHILDLVIFKPPE